MEFFGHVARFHDPTAFGAALDAARPVERDRTIEQAWVVSRFVQRKYTIMRGSFHAFGAAAGLQGAALVLDLLF